VLRRLGTAEGQADYFDRAIIEYTAAIYHYEQARHERYCGINLNNIAFLLSLANMLRDRHKKLYDKRTPPTPRLKSIVKKGS
jgi:hypothetical protein